MRKSDQQRLPELTPEELAYIESAYKSIRLEFKATSAAIKTPLKVHETALNSIAIEESLAATHIPASPATTMTVPEPPKRKIVKLKNSKRPFFECIRQDITQDELARVDFSSFVDPKFREQLFAFVNSNIAALNGLQNTDAEFSPFLLLASIGFLGVILHAHSLDEICERLPDVKIVDSIFQYLFIHRCRLKHQSTFVSSLLYSLLERDRIEPHNVPIVSLL